MKTYRFVEPHYTGGHCTIDITEEQIIKHMKNLYQDVCNLDNDELVQDFVAIHWCWVIT
jgi:hypothetical protein